MHYFRNRQSDDRVYLCSEQDFQNAVYVMCKTKFVEVPLIIFVTSTQSNWKYNISAAAPRLTRIITPMGQDYIGQDILIRPLPVAPVRAIHLMQLKAPVQTPSTSVVEGLLTNLYQ